VQDLKANLIIVAKPDDCTLRGWTFVVETLFSFFTNRGENFYFSTQFLKLTINSIDSQRWSPLMVTIIKLNNIADKGADWSDKNRGLKIGRNRFGASGAMSEKVKCKTIRQLLIP